jgi:hypothetical protein
MNRATFFDTIRPRSYGLFPGTLTATQVRGIEGILDAFDQVGDGRRASLAYTLATAHHETGRRFEPVREGFAKSDAGARKAVARLASTRGPDSAPAKYGRPVPPYGHVYYGRGFPQLTWIDNYRRASAAAGVDLVRDPDKMLDPVISARVLIRGIIEGWWNGTQGKGVAHYELLDGRPGFSREEARQARRTVNVLDQADKIAVYALAYEAALARAGMPAEVRPRPTRPVSLTPAAPAPVPSAPKANGLTARLSAFIAAIAATFRRK